MKKTSKIKLTVIISSLCLCVTAYAAVTCLRSFTFDEEKSLDKWSKMILNGEVEYTLMKSGDDGYVKAISNNACSALYHRVGFKLKDYPNLTWKWRVAEFPDISVARTEEEKDDYADIARERVRPTVVGRVLEDEVGYEQHRAKQGETHESQSLALAVLPSRIQQRDGADRDR